MKRIIIKTISAFAVALTAVSCLDFDPKAQLGGNLVWDTAANYELYANQFYGWTRDFQGSTSVTYMNGFSDGPHSDYRSDLLVDENFNHFAQGSNSISTTDANYNNLYKRIYYTNLLLKNAASFANPSEIAASVGEAYFFRAYLYFELVQLYGDAVLLTEPIDTDSEKLYGKRDNRLTVIKQCVSDLKEASKLLPETPKANGRICKYTADAFLSRVALYEGTWQKFHNGNTEESKALLKDAYEAAESVMNSGNYELFFNKDLGARDSYRYMFILENTDCNPAKLQKDANKEYIFAKIHDEVIKPIGLNITHAAIGNHTNATLKLAEMYRCQNGLPIHVEGNSQWKGYVGMNTDFDNRDNRMNATLLKNDQIYWNNDGKWRTAWDDTDVASSNKAGRKGNTGFINYKWATERSVKDANEGYDYPIIRYAEVLLNYAEAKYEYADAISNDDLNKSLNLVRKRSNPDMTALSNELVNAHSDMNMREEIRAERTVELFLEGFRIDDLKRWKTAEIEMPQDALGISVADGTYWKINWTNHGKSINADGFLIIYDGRVWEQKHYLLPLPTDELQLNPELGQNPNWK